MIAFVTGTVTDLKENEVIVDVNGVGYRITAPTTVTSVLKPGKTNVTIHTTMVVTDNQMNLYGFASPDDRDVFELLTTVSGIGPKAAVKLLSLPRAKLVDAIAGEDAALLSTVPGIGPKTAKRVILELKEKVGKLYGGADGFVPVPSVERGSEADMAVQGLKALGYSPGEIRGMMKDMDQDEIKGMGASEIIKICLKRK